MDAKTLQKHLDKLSHHAREHKEREAYAKGVNPPIFSAPAKSAPDNRIAIPIVKKAIDQYTGYMAKAGKIKYSGDYYDTVLKPIYNANDEELLNSKEFRQALIHGKVFELHWVDKNGSEVNFFPLPGGQCVPIFSDDIRPELEAFIWHRKLDSDDGDKDHATVYDAFNQEEWELGVNGWQLLETIPHPYGIVPVNIGYISDDQSNLFDHVRDLIDFLDKVISGDYANESERFANAYLLIAERINTEKDPDTGKSDLDRFREMLTFEFPGSDSVKDKIGFLTKDINVEFIKLIKDTCLDLIHDMMPMIDMRDQTIGASASGVAQEWKLLPIENKASEMEANFSRFLQGRIKLISAALGNLGNVASQGVNIKFDRNLPRDMDALVTWLSKSDLSLEGRLEQYPRDVVPDVQKELDRINADQPDMTVTDPNNLIA